MRSHALQLIAATVFFLPLCPSRAALITVDTVIGPDSPHNGTGIEVADGIDGPTTVEIIEGATVRGLQGRENSHVVLDSGPITSISDLHGISFLSQISGTSRLDVRSGLFACFAAGCDTLDYSAVLEMNDSSELHLHGGYFSGPIDVRDTSTVFVYGRQLEADVSSTPGYVPQRVIVTGEYLSGEPVTVTANVYPYANIVLVEIPEPASGVLFACVMAAGFTTRGIPDTPFFGLAFA